MAAETQTGPREETQIFLSNRQLPEYILRYIGDAANARFFKVLVRGGEIIPTDENITLANGEVEKYITEEDGVQTIYSISQWRSVLIGQNPPPNLNEMAAYGFDAKTSSEPDVLEYIEARIRRANAPRPKLPYP